MDDKFGFEIDSDSSPGISKSQSKLMTGEKRGCVEQEGSRKRVKMRNLESVFRSEGEEDGTRFGSKEMSEVTEAHTTTKADGVGVVARERDLLTTIDLNSTGYPRNELDRDHNITTSRGIDLDLNGEDVSSSGTMNPFYPYKELNISSKPRDVLECGSSTGPLEDKDPLRVWKQMKQNGFLSSFYGGIPIPNKRGRKSKQDVLKRNLELAKKEQVDRFTKLAAPSGLLNELNPGIINHVRNSKQVHSIIEALVRSEQLEKKGNREAKNKDTSQLGTSHVESTTMDAKWVSLGGYGDSSVVEKKGCDKIYSNVDDEDDMLALKLSSSTAKESEVTDSMHDEDTGSVVSSLSVKAASVASQWLELLHQDIKGRLAALKRSKKRVRAVIQTEMPFLVSKEFSENQENVSEMHRMKWSTLFDQMDKSLCEEEKHLEKWLNQVKDMQFNCDQGLHHVQGNLTHALVQMVKLGNNSSSVKVENAKNELAVQAAAASIYSTCNFLMSMGDVSCF